MQLDKFTDYALRVLMALTVRAPDRVPASEIAAVYGLSEHHIAKVASALVKAGFAVSERGRSGGLQLAREPSEITVGQVVRALKADTPVVECIGSDKSCRILPACGLRTPLQEAREAFFAALDPYTLEDITVRRSTIRFQLWPEAGVAS